MKEFDAGEFREEGHKLIDKLADYLDNISKGKGYPVLAERDPENLYKFFLEKLEKNKDNDLDSIIDEFIESSNHLHHPGYIGHQCTPPLPYAALTHLTAGLLNNGSAVYEMGPANIAMERAILRHISDKLGFDKKSDGVLTHGGSAGNLTALLAARQAKASYNIWEEGVRQEALPAYIVSEQSHYSISRNLKIMGLGDAACVPIAVDDNFKIRTDLLEKTYKEAEEKGLKVIAVVANACSTATGSYDDLDAIGDFCKLHNLWFHVDGAHGMGAIMSEEHKHLVSGIKKADSLIIDFHKMFLITGLNTAVIFKNGDRSYETFAQKASYLFEKTHDKEWYNGAKRTLECTKSSMGLHAYSMFRIYGDEFFANYINQSYALASDFYQLIGQTNDFESVTFPEANIVCFRFTGRNKEKELNDLNRKIREVIIKSGNFYIVQAELLNKVWLRVCLINPLTNIEKLKELLDEIRIVAKNK